MLSSVTGFILTHSRLLAHSRAMCRADAENFERSALFHGFVELDIPMNKNEKDDENDDENDDGGGSKTNMIEPDKYSKSPSLKITSQFLIGASYQVEKECLIANLVDTSKVIKSVFAAVTLEQ